MYGAGEFDNGFGLNGLDALVDAAQTQPEVVLAVAAASADKEGTQDDEIPVTMSMKTRLPRKCRRVHPSPMVLTSGISVRATLSSTMLTGF
jgi:hypothetical protein